MDIKKIRYKQFEHAYELTNKKYKMIVVTDAGPRILHFSLHNGVNVLFIDTSGKLGKEETGWLLYGGHRFWIGPESFLTPSPDNDPCDVRINDESIDIIRYAPETKLELKLTIAEKNGRFTINHTVTNKASCLFPAALWGLTCFKAEGTIFIPWRDPSSPWQVSKILYWQNWDENTTNIESNQYEKTADFFKININGEEGKVGSTGSQGYIGITTDTYTFVKSCDYVHGAVYPDDNCAIESYTNDQFIELETLSPLYTFLPGKPYHHREEWFLTDKKLAEFSNDCVTRMLESGQ